MERNLNLLLCVILALTTETWSYPNGFLPDFSCMNGPTGHRSNPQRTPPPFSVEVFHAADNSVATDYTAGETLEGELLKML